MTSSAAATQGAPREPESDARAADDASHHLRTTFLRRVAHDIASPTGVTLTVLDEIAHADKVRPELVAMAKRSLRRLMRLSEHLALAAELENGGLVLELASADITALTKQALDDALAIDGRKDVVAACDLPPSPLLVVVDPRLLPIVLREVLGNALKLASSRVEVTVKAEGGSVSIRVDDDGPGFNAESLRLLGKRFVRREASRGLGLSLAMSIAILRAHGASLVVEPSLLPPGRRGTTGAGVVITLPVGSAPSATTLDARSNDH
jgi:two-component system sensor histidine kinase KdpD